MDVSEDKRAVLYRAGAHAAWWSTFALLAIHIGLGGSRPNGTSPPWLGLIIITLIGVAIALGTALSRMRLADTISGVFQAGYRAGVSHGCAVIEVGPDGVIRDVTHAEAIGRTREVLIGQPVTSVIPEQSGRGAE